MRVTVAIVAAYHDCGQRHRLLWKSAGTVSHRFEGHEITTSVLKRTAVVTVIVWTTVYSRVPEIPDEMTPASAARAQWKSRISIVATTTPTTFKEITVFSRRVMIARPSSSHVRNVTRTVRADVGLFPFVFRSRTCIIVYRSDGWSRGARSMVYDACS